MLFSNLPKGATPIDDVSGLKIKNIYTLEELNKVEMANIIKATKQHLIPRVPHLIFGLIIMP